MRFLGGGNPPYHLKGLQNWDWSGWCPMTALPLRFHRASPNGGEPYHMWVGAGSKNVLGESGLTCYQECIIQSGVSPQWCTQVQGSSEQRCSPLTTILTLSGWKDGEARWLEWEDRCHGIHRRDQKEQQPTCITDSVVLPFFSFSLILSNSALIIACALETGTF